MTASEEYNKMSIVKDLAEAVSTQSKITNRTWLATITVSVLILFSSELASQGKIPLPFSMGNVEQKIFYPIGFSIQAVLILALAVAHALALRARKLAHLIIATLEPKCFLNTPYSIRDFFDVMQISCLPRVAPLAQWIRGPYQFSDKENQCPNSLRYISTAYYIVLKFIATTVLFLMPGSALYYSYKQVISIQLNGFWVFFLTALGIISALSLMVVTIIDSEYVWRVFKLMLKVDS
jgi:hypothetical protein